MHNERWQRVSELFDRVTETPPAEWDEQLARLGGDDGELIAEVGELLEADRRAGSATFLDRPLVELRRALSAGAPGFGDGAGEGEGPPRTPLTTSSEGSDARWEASGELAVPLAAAGDRLGPYRLLRLIQDGGMGSVYLAVRDDDEYRRLVAIKLLRPTRASRDAQRRFRTERQILAQLEHPNIARLYDGGTTGDGRPYLVMEHIDGLPITEFCQREGLTLTQRIRLFCLVCAAVDHAHQHLLVHRDIKPGNILVTAKAVPKLIDFGIAKPLAVFGAVQPGPTTEAGRHPMTPAYASPEQVQGETVTTLSDVYSLGVLLHELLTGVSPYRDAGDGQAAGDHGAGNGAGGATPVPSDPRSMRPRPTPGETAPAEKLAPHELARAICVEEVARPSQRVSGGGPRVARNAAASGLEIAELRRQLKGDLDTIVLKALRKEPERRYGSASELARDLERHLGCLPIHARPDTLRYRTSKFARRNRGKLAAAAAILLLAYGLVATMLRSDLRIEAERQRTETTTRRLVDLLLMPEQGAQDDQTTGELLGRGAEIMEARFAEDPVALAGSLEGLAQLADLAGDLDMTAELLRRTLDLQMRTGSSAAEIAVTLHNQGVVANRSGRFDEAEQFFGQALAITVPAAGQVSSEDLTLRIAESRSGLGLALWRLGRTLAAERELRTSVELRRRVAGEADPRLADGLADLGRFLLEERRLGEAREPLREALAIRLRSLPPEHTALAETHRLLGQLAGELGDYASGVPHFRRAVEVYLQRQEPHRLASAFHDLARCLGGAGRYDEAKSTFRLSLEQYNAVQGADEPWLDPTQQKATVLNDLSVVLTYSGMLREAEAMLEQVVGTFELAADDHPAVVHGHPGLLKAKYNLGAVRHAQGRLAEAEGLYREVIEGRDRFMRPTDPGWSYPDIAMARVHLDRGRTELARPLLFAALAQLEATHPEGHWRIAEARSLLAAYHLVDGQPDQALELLVPAAATLTAQRSEADPRTRRTVALLAEARSRVNVAPAGPPPSG